MKFGHTKYKNCILWVTGHDQGRVKRRPNFLPQQTKPPLPLPSLSSLPGQSFTLPLTTKPIPLLKSHPLVPSIFCLPLRYNLRSYFSSWLPSHTPGTVVLVWKPHALGTYDTHLQHLFAPLSCLPSCVAILSMQELCHNLDPWHAIHLSVHNYLKI